MRTLSIVALVLVLVSVVVGLSSDSPPIEGPSPEMREIFKYAITAVLVAFVGYLAMSRR